MSYLDLVPLSGRMLGADVDDDGQDFAGGVDNAGDLIFTAVVPFKCRLHRSGCLITEAVTGATTTAILKVWKNGTGGTLLATLTLATTAAGKMAYEDPTTHITLAPGDRVDFEMDVKSTGAGAPSGKGYPMVLVEYIPETATNLSNMVAV